MSVKIEECHIHTPSLKLFFKIFFLQGSFSFLEEYEMALSKSDMESHTFVLCMANSKVEYLYR